MIMIIKSLSHKQDTYSKLYDYFHTEEVKKDAILYHNFYDVNEKEVLISEFQQSIAVLPTRKNGVKVYHDILSLPHQDSKKIPLAKQKEILLDLARYYLKKRGHLHLAYGVIHEHSKGKHLHCHLMISPNELGMAKRHYFSKKEFLKIQKEVERYKEERYPYLVDQRLYDKELTKNLCQTSKSKDRESRVKHRTQSSSRTEILQRRVQEALILSYSMEDFQKKLKEKKLSFYVRGNTPGIIDLDAQEKGEKCYKFRLKRLGVDTEYEKLLTYERSFLEKKKDEKELRREHDHDLELE